MKTHPPFTAHVYQHRRIGTAEHTAEAAWRAVGVQVIVTTMDGAIRSNLVNGMPR